MQLCQTLIEQDLDRNAKWFYKLGNTGELYCQEIIQMNFGYINAMLEVLPEEHAIEMKMKYILKSNLIMQELRNNMKAEKAKQRIYDAIIKVYQEMYKFVQLSIPIPETYFEWIQSLHNMYDSNLQMTEAIRKCYRINYYNRLNFFL